MDGENIKEIIPRRILFLRKKAGLTQAQLAEKVGISKPAVSGYENGKQLPSLENLIGISKVLGVSLDELIHDCEGVNKPAPSLEEQFTDIFYRIGVGVVQWGFNVIRAGSLDPMDAVFAHTALHYNNKAWDGALTEFASLRGARMSLPKEQVFKAIEVISKKYAKDVVNSDLFRFSLGPWPN